MHGRVDFGRKVQVGRELRAHVHGGFGADLGQRGGRGSGGGARGRGGGRPCTPKYPATTNAKLKIKKNSQRVRTDEM